MQKKPDYVLGYMVAKLFDEIEHSRVSRQINYRTFLQRYGQYPVMTSF